MKSLLSGAFWGIFSGGIAVSLVSLVAPQPAGSVSPESPQVQTPVAAADVPEPEPVAVEPEVVAVEIATEAAKPVGLAPVSQSPLPVADTAPLSLPETGAVDTALALPSHSQLPLVDAAGEEPVLPNPQSIAPQVPTVEDDLIISTRPAALPVEEVEAPVDIAEVDIAPELEDPVVADNAEEPVAVSEDVAPVTEDAPELELNATAELEVPEVDEESSAPSDEAPAPEIADAPELETPSPVEGEPEIADNPTAPEAPTEDRAPVVVSIIETNETSSLPGSSSRVVVNRSVGTADVEEEEPAVVAEVDPDAPAISRYAAAFENAEGKPTMALVLLDDGSLQEAVNAIGQVPFPITVALDPTAKDAAATMEAYRAAGVEVALLAKLPKGAQPTDVEIALEAAFASLPETVVMVDTGDGNLQSSRAVLTQAMTALAADGRGLVTVSQGLNTGLQVADDLGVPAELIFRDLDGEGQDARVIQRFLDQAAFRARQNSGVVLLARMRADTLTALIQWGDANRAGQVAMAPVSAILTEE